MGSVRRSRVNKTEDLFVEFVCDSGSVIKIQQVGDDRTKQTKISFYGPNFSNALLEEKDSGNPEHPVEKCITIDGIQEIAELMEAFMGFRDN